MTTPHYVDHADEWFEVFDQFEDDAALEILRTYLKLHEGKIGAHWLWCALERIAGGEREEQVLSDYCYYRGGDMMNRVHPADPLVIHEWKRTFPRSGLMITLCEKVVARSYHFQDNLLPAGPDAQLCPKCQQIKDDA